MWGWGERNVDDRAYSTLLRVCLSALERRACFLLLS